MADEARSLKAYGELPENSAPFSQSNVFLLTHTYLQGFPLCIAIVHFVHLACTRVLSELSSELLNCFKECKTWVDPTTHVCLCLTPLSIK